MLAEWLSVADWKARRDRGQEERVEDEETDSEDEETDSPGAYSSIYREASLALVLLPSSKPSNQSEESGQSSNELGFSCIRLVWLLPPLAQHIINVAELFVTVLAAQYRF